MASTIEYAIMYKFGKSGGWCDHSRHSTENNAYDEIGKLTADDIKHGFTPDSMDTYYYKVVQVYK